MKEIDLDLLIKEIYQVAEKRYIIRPKEESYEFFALADTSLILKKIVQMRRREFLESHWRTVLIVDLDHVEDQKIALRWAGEVRRELPDPEASDLYMIMLIKDASINDCTRIESREEFCRKFVLRPNESLYELISRTFISYLSQDKSDDEITDPLLEAFRKTEEKHEGFDKNMQDHWKRCLLSGRTSNELVNVLFSSNYIDDPNNG